MDVCFSFPPCRVDPLGLVSRSKLRATTSSKQAAREMLIRTRETKGGKPKSAKSVVLCFSLFVSSRASFPFCWH